MSQSFNTIDQLDAKGKKILLRVDINVPVIDGVISDDTRLRHIIPTVNELTNKGAAVILVAHFGRPKGQVVPEMSLKPVCDYLSSMLNKPIVFAPKAVGDETKALANSLKAGDIMMLENIRFEAGEEKNDIALSKSLASIADAYVNDAFSAAHRAHSSTEGVTHFLPTYAGRGMQAELEALEKALQAPKRPVAAIVGGAKVSSKITLLENLLEKVDVLVIGGGMANTFLAARGYKVGKSLCETDFIETANRIEDRALSLGKQIIIPIDVVVTKEFKAGAEHRICSVKDVQNDEMILDAGNETVKLLRQVFASMKTIVWNGPLGAFEFLPFDKATVEAAKIVAELTDKGIVTSIAGGGDTVSALNHAGVSQNFTYISTAGGAFLEWMEGKELPGVKALFVKSLAA